MRDPLWPCPHRATRFLDATTQDAAIRRLFEWIARCIAITVEVFYNRSAEPT